MKQFEFTSFVLSEKGIVFMNEIETIGTADLENGIISFEFGEELEELDWELFLKDYAPDFLKSMFLKPMNKPSFKIYTCYHAQKSKVEDLGLVAVNISQKPPHWDVYDKHYYLFAPTPDIRKMEVDDYIPAFKRHLSTLNYNQVMDDLARIGEGKDIALMCYEKIGDFCHRHLVAEWLAQQSGMEIKELDLRPKDLFNI